MESTRAKESAVKRETAEQLELFRKQQEETEKAARLAGADEPSNEGETWAVKKRKRGREKETLGLKLRKSSSTNSHSIETVKEEARATTEPPGQEKPRDPAPTPKHTEPKSAGLDPPAVEKAVAKAAKSPTPTVEKSPPPAVALGLAGYSSDED